MTSVLAICGGARSWPIGLVIAGAALQVGGFILALVDLRRTRDAADEYELRGQVVEIGAAVEADVALPIGAVKGGEQPTLEQRIEALESAVRGLRENRDEDWRRLRGMFEEKLGETRGVLERARRRDHAALEGLVRSMGNASLGQRRWGVGLFVVGLLLLTAGSICSLCCTAVSRR